MGINDELQKQEIAAAGVTTEKQMREQKAEWPKTEEELIAHLRSLVNRPHDYGTCVYAMSLAAVAAFNYISHALGVTGFQASCADMDIIRRTRGWERFRLVNYDDMLYPQMKHKFEKVLHPETWKQLQEQARTFLGESLEDVHPNVLAHWQSIAAGHVPFGYVVREED